MSLCSTEFCTASTITWTIMPMPVPSTNMYAEELSLEVCRPIVDSMNSEIAMRAVPTSGKIL